ncbi:glycoside hydrolase family 13 protein [Lactarius quietus]|nr:glycoside hydrolase family 13 protein [Lactarius quietus]
MALFLVSILSFVAFTYAGPHAARSAFEDRAVIAQMFEWNWDSVATECAGFLGPAGYGYVQVSPAQEHIQGPEWWTDYQPVSYILTSKRGTRKQYEHMIRTCHAAGVGVIADTIWNHMTMLDFGIGVAGSSFSHYDYPGLYEYLNFHHCGLEPNDTIVNYNNEIEVWTCELDGLADLATETNYVRGRLAEYTNDLLSLGVDGLRLDAAKHMNPDDIADILTRLITQPYVTQEVIWGPGQPVNPALYTGNGDVQEFRYTSALRDAFQGLDGGISSLEHLDDRGWVPGSSANAFVSNHDTERNKGSLNVYSSSNAYTLATIFSLAHPYGKVSILSSYADFFNTDAGAPNLGTGRCEGQLSVDGWLCQHRWQAIVGMVGFRNQVGRAPLTRWVSPSPQQIAFARGSDGFVTINNENSSWSTTFKTGLPSGSYCNVIDGFSSYDGTCTGSAFTIDSDGSLTVAVGARQAIAVHTGALGSGTSEPKTAEFVPVLFDVNATTTFGENIFGVGNVPGLGNWDLSNAIPLDPTNYPVWAATAYLSPNTAFQYSFIRKETNGTIITESGPTREGTTPGSGILSIVTSWR